MYVEIPIEVANALAFLFELGESYTGRDLTDALKGVDSEFDAYGWSVQIEETGEGIKVYLLVNHENEEEAQEWIESYTAKIDELVTG